MGTRRTYNAYGEDMATIENALAAVEADPDTETIGEALAVLLSPSVTDSPTRVGRPRRRATFLDVAEDCSRRSHPWVASTRAV